MKQLLKKASLFGLAVAFVSIFISFIVGEFIVKHVMPQETYQLARSVGLNIFEESPIIPYTLQKNVNLFLHIAFTREFTHYVSTNSQRTRGKEFIVEKPADTYRILFLGDSITFGWGVEDEDAYPVLVEKYLNQILKTPKYKRVEIINAGFTDGNSPDTFYLYYKEIGVKYNPDLVIVNFHPPNDIYDIYYHTWDTIDRDEYPTKISSKTHNVRDGYLVSKKKTKWKFEIPILRNSHVGILFLKALENGAPDIVERIKKIVGVEEEKEAFTMEQNYECLEAIVQEKCPAVLWPQFEVTKRMFQGIQNIGDTNNQEVLFTFMPGPQQIKQISKKSDGAELINAVNPQKYYREFFMSEEMNYLDFTPSLIKRDVEGLFYNLDGHIKQEGHMLVTKDIVTYLQKTKPELFVDKLLNLKSKPIVNSSKGIYMTIIQS